HNTTLETARQLMRNIPKEQWSQAHHWLIHHGRKLCHARNPRCGECPLLSLCPDGQRRIKSTTPKKAVSLANAADDQTGASRTAIGSPSIARPHQALGSPQDQRGSALS